MTTIYLTFDTNLAEANRLAEELQEYILEQEKIELQRVKDNANTMDFGATLAIVLGTPAIVALAKSIDTWLIKKENKTISFQDGDKKWIGKNLSSDDLQAFFDGISKTK